MKTRLILLISFTVVYLKGNWFYDFEQAREIAIAQNKLILVDFYAEWCGPCRLMDKDIWSKKDVQQLMGNFVPVKINFDLKKDLVSQFSEQAIRSVLIMDAHGKVLLFESGYLAKPYVLNLLTKHTTNMAFLQKNLLAHYKKNSFKSAYFLAKRYLDFSILIPKEKNRFSFLTVAEDYLKESTKKIKELKKEKQVTYNERIALYKIQSLLIKQKSNKALRKLKKFNPKEINPKNKPLLNFLFWLAHAAKKDDKSEFYFKSLNQNYINKSLAYQEKLLNN